MRTERDQLVTIHPKLQMMAYINSYLRWSTSLYEWYSHFLLKMNNDRKTVASFNICIEFKCHAGCRAVVDRLYLNRKKRIELYYISYSEPSQLPSSTVFCNLR